MGKNEEEFIKKLLVTFKTEAAEHVQLLSSGFFELEKTSDVQKQLSIIETIFREVHSLKGAARSVNASGIESLCQSLESIFAAGKQKRLDLSPEWFDLFHQAAGELSHAVKILDSDPVFSSPKMNELRREFERKLKQGNRSESESAKQSQKTVPQETEAFSPENVTLTDTIRISRTKLDALLLQAEEMLSIKLTLAQRAKELQEMASSFSIRKKKWSRIRPAYRTLQQTSEKDNFQEILDQKNYLVKRLLEFLEQDIDFSESFEDKLTMLTSSAEQDFRSVTGMLDHVLEDMKHALMLPFDSLLEIFPKLVRDLSKNQGKQSELVIQGADFEIDRRILEEIKDPLIHLVRNSIDHGIEKPEERLKNKKPAQAKIQICISQKEGNKIEMVISDDGQGIALERLRQSVLKLGLLNKETVEKLEDSQLLQFIFYSGVSTSPTITDISGRGLGLAIVREKVEKLGGSIVVETHPNLGTSFRINLPLTLATFRGVLVRAGERQFILPSSYVESAVRVKKEEIKTVENRETIRIQNQALSLVRLTDTLALKRRSNDSEKNVQIIILNAAQKRIGFLVDETYGEQEVLMKNLGKQLLRVRNIAGASVLGSGKVVPILHVPDLMMQAVNAPMMGQHPEVELKQEAKKKSILIAEDSITARTLLKSILESAGYLVTAAVDGMDAFTQLRSGEFDMVISDVEMPRMTGLDLTARIRADKKFSQLPIILVTALGTREDRERGIEVGANAYIIKSSFDQSNLLEVIKRFL